MTTRFVRLTQLALVLTTLVPRVGYAQTSGPVAGSKLDESLRESVQQGCIGTKSVIVRTQPGYRQGLRDSLSQHGDIVTGEFAALDAVSAEVHCADLETLASFTHVNSISVNARVGVQSLGDDLGALEAAVDAAKVAAQNAKEAVKAAQRDVQLAEARTSTAQANLAGAQKAAAKASLAAKPAALANVLVQQGALKAAQDALTVARDKATIAQANALGKQEALEKSKDALGSVLDAMAAREREGRAARGLKKKFFATMPMLGESHVHTDEQIDATDTGDYAGSFQNAFGEQSRGGGSVGIAVIDSGIEPGIDFENRITAFYDFTQGDIRAATASDGYGHGTHVAGLAASQFVGVAPNARLIGLKVLDARGQGTTLNVVRAIEFAIANKDLLGINLINLSLGHPIFEPAATDPLVQAVEHASRAGIAVVISAGNFGMNPKNGQSGYAGIASPANAPSGLAVGAARTFNSVTRLDDRVAPYSSRGPSWYDGFAKPDFMAPGDNLLSIAAVNSTLRLAQERRGNTGNYMRLSGTSMAAAVASGVAALVLDANRSLTPNTVKAVLEFTAIPMKDDNGATYDALTQGTGEIEITGAVAYARAIDPHAPIGNTWLSTSITPSTMIGGTTYAWSQSIIWGTRRVAGATLLSEQRPAWALSIVWGEGLGEEDDNIVWGNDFEDDDNIVWGNLFDLDDNIVWGNNIVFGGLDDEDDNIVWGNFLDELDDNIVWGNCIVWGDGLLGLFDDDNIVWGNDLSFLWGALDDDNIVWGNLFDLDDNIVWGNLDDDDNIVWGNDFDDDNIVWGNSGLLGDVVKRKWSGGVVVGKADNARARRTRVQKVVVL